MEREQVLVESVQESGEVLAWVVVSDELEMARVSV